MLAMKRLLLLLFCSGALIGAAELSGVQSVYVMSMSRGMDQYLANRLAGERIFRVVTDPKLADAVLSDRFGEAFQSQLEALLPPPAPEKQADEEAEKDDSGSATPLFSNTANKLANPATTSSFGRARGTVFLVDKESRQVIWSTYLLPKDSTSKELDRTASDIVSRLKRDLHAKASPKKKSAPPEMHHEQPAPAKAEPPKTESPKAAPKPAQPAPNPPDK